MRKQMYAILDKTARMYLNPLTLVNDGDAIRLFTTFVNDPEEKTNVAKYPDQFSLYFVGEFDDELGKFIECPNRELIQGMSVKDSRVPESRLADIIIERLKSNGVRPS